MNQFTAALSIRTIAKIFAGANANGFFIPATILEQFLPAGHHISNRALNQALTRKLPGLFHPTNEQFFQAWHNLPHLEIINLMQQSTAEIEVVGFGYDLDTLHPINSGIVHHSYPYGL